jgi:hypothetical protein
MVAIQGKYLTLWLPKPMLRQFQHQDVTMHADLMSLAKRSAITFNHISGLLTYRLVGTGAILVLH